MVDDYANIFQENNTWQFCHYQLILKGQKVFFMESWIERCVNHLRVWSLAGTNHEMKNVFSKAKKLGLVSESLFTTLEILT